MQNFGGKSFLSKDSAGMRGRLLDGDDGFLGLRFDATTGKYVCVVGRVDDDDNDCEVRGWRRRGRF